MLEDREGNVWLASPAKGLVRIRHRRVTYLQAQDRAYEKSIITCFRSRGGTRWIAPRSGGIDRLRDGKLTHIDSPPKFGIVPFPASTRAGLDESGSPPGTHLSSC